MLYVINIYFYEHYILLLDCPLYHYVVLLFVIISVFVLKFILSDMTIAAPALIFFPCYIFFSILSLSIYVHLQL